LGKSDERSCLPEGEKLRMGGKGRDATLTRRVSNIVSVGKKKEGLFSGNEKDISREIVGAHLT